MSYTTMTFRLKLHAFFAIQAPRHFLVLHIAIAVGLKRRGRFDHPIIDLLVGRFGRRRFLPWGSKPIESLFSMRIGNHGSLVVLILLIGGPRNLRGAFSSNILTNSLARSVVDKQSKVVQSLPSPLAGDSSLLDAALGLGASDMDGLGHGRGGDLGSTEQDESEPLVNGTVGIGVEVEEGEAGVGARRAEVGRGRRRMGGAVGVGEGGAFGACEALGGGWGRGAGGIVQLEAGGAEVGGMQTQDAGGA